MVIVLRGLLRRAAASIHRDERGMSAITTMGMAGVMGVLSMVISVQALGNIRETRVQKVTEQAIQVAESGVDHTLYLLTEDPLHNTGDAMPAFSSRAQEQQWVLNTAATKTATRAAGGEWVAIKPINAAVVYSVGYVPSKADPTNVRVVRAEYDSGPFNSPVAVLTDRNLEISGNATIAGASGSAHANGDGVASGSPRLDGYFSAAGNLTTPSDFDVGEPENTGGGRPVRAIPMVDPRSNYYMSQYDLCSDGTVRSGPAYTGSEGANPSSVPCTGPVLTFDAGAGYRGWSRTGSTWHYTGQQNYDGVYYVYHGDAKVTGNVGKDSPWNVSIIAEQEGSGACAGSGGSIEVEGTPRMRSHASAQQVLLMAGRNVRISGDASLGDSNSEGLIASRESFDISGNADIHGVVMSNQTCQSNGASVVTGSATITYNGGLEVPSDETIRATLWEEL